MIIEHEDIRAYFENLIKTRLEAYAQLNSAYDLSDEVVVANENYDGKVKKDIKVILKFLSAQNVNGVIDMPIQILVEVKTDLQDLIFNILQDIAYSLNQTVDGILNNSNEYEYKFKQFYNTPILMNSFQNGGAFKTSTLTMDARFVVFESLSTLSGLYLSFTTTEDDEIEYDDNSYEIEDFKKNLLNAVFHIQYNFDGRILRDNPLQENKVNSYNITFTLNYVLDPNSFIQKYLWENSTRNTMMNIKYKTDNTFNEMKNFKCHIQSYTDNLLVSDVTKVTVVFVSTIGG